MSKKLRMSVEIVLPDDAFAQHKTILALEPAKKEFEKRLRELVAPNLEVEAQILTIVNRSNKSDTPKAAAAPAAAE